MEELAASATSATSGVGTLDDPVEELRAHIKQRENLCRALERCQEETCVGDLSPVPFLGMCFQSHSPEITASTTSTDADSGNFTTDVSNSSTEIINEALKSLLKR